MNKYLSLDDLFVVALSNREDLLVLAAGRAEYEQEEADEDEERAAGETDDMVEAVDTDSVGLFGFIVVLFESK